MRAGKCFGRDDPVGFEWLLTVSMIEQLIRHEVCADTLSHRPGKLYGEGHFLACSTKDAYLLEKVVGSLPKW